MNKALLTFIGSFIASVLSFVLPYYVLPEGSYIPKRIPAFGYFMPRTSVAWFFLILGLIFLIITIVSAYKYKLSKQRQLPKI